jgi:hypothetical protein
MRRRGMAGDHHHEPPPTEGIDGFVRQYLKTDAEVNET